MVLQQHKAVHVYRPRRGKHISHIMEHKFLKKLLLPLPHYSSSSSYTHKSHSFQHSATKTRVVDPDLDFVGSASICRIRIGIDIQGMLIRIRKGSAYVQNTENYGTYDTEVTYNTIQCNPDQHQNDDTQHLKWFSNQSYIFGSGRKGSESRLSTLKAKQWYYSIKFS